MNAVLIVITVVQLLVALALILIVLFQSGKSQGLSGAIGAPPVRTSWCPPWRRPSAAPA